MMSRGSTTLFLLFDIFSTPPKMTGWPSSRAVDFQRPALVVVREVDLGRVEPALLARGILAVVAVVRQHALREEPLERLVELDQAHVAHHFGPEARVQQVQNRVLDAADVLVHRHPVIVARIDHRRRVRRAVAHVVPGRIDEGVHRVGLAPRRLAAGRARARQKRLVLCERAAAAVRDEVLGQHDRQVLLGHRHRRRMYRSG